LQQPFETMQTVLTAEEIINHAFNEATKAEVEFSDKVPTMVKAKKREGARIMIAEKETAGYLEAIVKSVPTLDDIHPFYREMLEIQLGVAKAKSALGRISRAARIIHEVGKASIRQLKGARNPTAAATARRAFMGRTSSLVRGAEEDLATISLLREKMKDLPTADPLVPTIVLAGYPGVGKSTIVSKLSSAKPMVRPYPFTTQEIIIGHIKSARGIIQVVDTPGILDRPLAERNKAELLAISALGYLSNIIAFIVDISESNGFSLSSQKHLLDDVKQTFANRDFLIFFNKVDLASPQQLEEAEALFGKCDRISATQGEGLEVFLEKLNQSVKRTLQEDHTKRMIA